MTTVILGGDNNAPSTSAANYNFPCAPVVTSWNATQSNRSLVAPMSFDLSDLYCEVGTAPSAGKSYKFTLMKNGSATALEATISDTATTANLTGTTVSFVAGDTFSMRITPTGTPTSTSMTFWGMKCTTATPSFPFFTMCLASPSTTVTQHLQYQGGSSIWTTTETSVQAPIPINGTIDSLRTDIITAPASGKQWDITTVKNASATTQTFTIANTAVTGSDAGHPVSITAGDTVTLRCAPTGTPTASGIFVSSGIFTPTTDGESFLLFANSGSPATTSVEYEQPIGGGGLVWQTPESSRYLVGPAIDAKAIYAKLGTASGAAKSWKIDLRIADADSGLAVTLSNTTTGNSATTVSIGAGNHIAWQTTPTGTPTTMSNGAHLGLALMGSTTPSSGLVSRLALLGVG